MRLSTFAVAATAMFLLGAGTDLTSPASAKPYWAPLDPAYVSQMYANKTWRWKHGAAYFGRDGRFKAWTRSGGALATAVGEWGVRDEGMICFSARWIADPNPYPSVQPPVVETCFSHSAKGRTIAQMRDPDGKWYIFKHQTTRPGDEFLQLRPGDRTGLKVD
jgi:hypothetical protein